MRAATFIAGIVLSGLVAVAPSGAVEQTIEPLNPTGVEQRIETMGGDQQVEAVRGLDDQTAEGVTAAEPPGPVAKAASTAGKVALGITGLGISIGVMVGTLLLL